MEVVVVVLPSVIAKLGDLLVGDYNLEKEVNAEIRSLQAELQSVKGALEQVYNTPPYGVDSRGWNWARDLRELSYDMEDCIDRFVAKYSSTKLAKQQGLRKVIAKSHGSMMQSMIRHRFAHEFNDIRRRITAFNEKLPRHVDKHEFDLDGTLRTACLHWFYNVNELVGIDETRDELIKIMMEDNRVPMQHGKIVSIVGMMGLGKTTLAIAVHNKIRELFDCCAFISVSQTPNMKKILEGLLYDLGKYINNKKEIIDEEQLINNLRKILNRKRYLIVIDDIWDISVWKSIRSVLPDNDIGYRIITTTCIHSIAEEIGGPYMLKPLSLSNSRKLLYRRILSRNINKENKEDLENEGFAELCDRILKKCAGVPYVILTVANLLSFPAKNYYQMWHEVCVSFGTDLHNKYGGGQMGEKFLFSYYNLPSHLRICLLYLCMFPEDYNIRKNRLIWKWIAEGFIQHGIPNKSLFELGESYFNELIDRSMIQPIYNHAGMICGCHIHHMVLDFIHYLAVKENFATVISGIHHRYSSNTIRRLCLQKAMEDHALTEASEGLEHVRSVIVFSSAVGQMLLIRSFQVLRVLDLQDCDLSQGYNLKHLGDLFHLRYLGLHGTGIDQLPVEIVKIQFLQTLDVGHTNISSLPSMVVQFRHLMCLYTDKSTKLPNGIGSLRNLEELSTLRIDNSTMDIIEELGQLKKLRVLKIIVLIKWNGKLVECLSKLQDIQILKIEVNIGDQRNSGRLDAWIASQDLRRLDAQRGCWFSTLPAWMNPSLLSGLYSLSITVKKLQQADLEILGKLPALSYLNLTVDHGSLGITEKFIVGSCLFPRLVKCQFSGFIIPVMFQQGAMPKLASIKMEFQVQNIRGFRDDGFDIGLGNLMAIEDATVLFDCKGATEWDLIEAEAAVRHAVELHPSRPTLRIITNERDVIFVRERGSISSFPSTSSQLSHVKEAHEKCDEYKIDAFLAKPVTTTVFQYMKGADLVGIEKAVNELMNILTEGNEMSTAQGKIVSIVGLGGIGKTTLARAIYGKLRAQFDCWAFVSVSQNPDMMKLFKCMLCQLGKKNSAHIHEEILDERLLIYELTEFLRNRRYFIVIDDIEDILVWKMIECALPACNGGCIIITTTHISDVAKQVGGAYRMRHLCPGESRILLHRRIFGTSFIKKRIFGPEDRGKYVDDELIELSEKILERCAGIPLAIIMISGLLASKGGNKIEWDKVYRCMKYGGPDEENMKTIVLLCYEDLPSHLKTCLLYLSVFPEGYDIDKDRLIRLWIGEGLIQRGKQDLSPFELGESYFQELIDRCMIRPVYKRRYYDMTECCHVHDMVLDLISEVTGKEKLASVWNHINHTFRSQEVQWLSLQNSMLDHATHQATENMQGVRSVFVFPSAVKLLPDLASFIYLRVLDLQSCCLSQGCSLNHLGNLVHLRYLGLKETGISHLSEEVGKLRSLQTLDVKRNEISSLPATVVELKHLMCLRIDSWTRAPNGIGSFTSLEELSTLCIQDSTDIIEELGNLTELRVLGIDCCTEWNIDEVEKALVECLHKLQKIQTLSISMAGECNLDAWIAAPKHLRRLELTGCWPSTVPALLNNPSLLLELFFLSIEVRKLRQEDLERLGRLPALSYLDIEVGNQSLGTVQTFIIGAYYFPCLVHCTLRGYIGPVVFQRGAMPDVARLHLVFPVREIRETAGLNGGGFDDLGFGNLRRLQDVSFLLHRKGASEREVQEVEAALRQAIQSHPNHPALEII